MLLRVAVYVFIVLEHSESLGRGVEPFFQITSLGEYASPRAVPVDERGALGNEAAKPWTMNRSSMDNEKGRPSLLHIPF